MSAGTICQNDYNDKIGGKSWGARDASNIKIVHSGKLAFWLWWPKGFTGRKSQYRVGETRMIEKSADSFQYAYQAS